MAKLKINSSGRIIRINSTTLARVDEGGFTSFVASENTNGGSYGAMGDQHYIFGSDLEVNGPDTASFNIDDNAGTNSIIWFYAKVGATEYRISYTQQEFAFTVGGRSIDSITISETGQSDIVYSLAGAESQTTYKNGAPYSSFDQFTLGSNIAKVKILPRNIPSSSGCNGSEDFGLFHLDVHFSDGLYDVDEVGGALYYIWKTAKDKVGVQNTTSEAGIDGLGNYLATGSDGFTNRTQFETAVVGVNISNISEAKSSVTIEEIAVKFNELAAINGTWTADWDPLVDGIPDCSSPMLACGTVTGDPTLFVTLTWVDADVTKSWLGCTWTKGEIKEVYATGYSKGVDSVAGYPSAGESWRRNQPFDNDLTIYNSIWDAANHNTLTSHIATMVVRLRNGNFPGQDIYTDYIRKYTWTTSYSFNIGAISSGDLISWPDYRLINKQKNGSFTDANNVTYAWSEGNGW